MVSRKGVQALVRPRTLRWTAAVAGAAIAGAGALWIRHERHGVCCPELADFKVEPIHDTEGRGEPTANHFLSVGALTLAENQLGWRILRELVAKDPSRSVVISPHAIALGLGVLATISSGETRAEVLRVLGFDEGLAESARAASPPNYHAPGQAEGNPTNPLDEYETANSVLELAFGARQMEEAMRLWREPWPYPQEWLMSDVSARGWRHTRNELPPVRGFAPKYASLTGVWFTNGLSGEAPAVEILRNAYRASVRAMEPSWNAEDLVTALDQWESKGIRCAADSRSGATSRGSVGTAALATGLRLDARWDFPGSLVPSPSAPQARAVEFSTMEKGSSQEIELVSNGAEAEIEVVFEMSPNPTELDRVPFPFANDVRWSIPVRPSSTTVPLFDVQTHVDLGPILADLGIRRAFEPGLAELTCAEGCGVVARLRRGLHRQSVSRFWHVARLAADDRGLNEAGFKPEPGEYGPPREGSLDTGPRVRPAKPFAVEPPFFVFVRDRVPGVFLYAAWIADPRDGSRR